MVTWSPTSAPKASSRYDDICFLDPERGWAVNSNGQILNTADGGATWTVQFQTPIVDRRPIWLRCVDFANERRGWAGTVSGAIRMFDTADGGKTWTPVELPDDAPGRVCGLWVVDENVVYASGTNYPTEPTAMVKTTDGGRTWSAWSMEGHADALIDVHFFDAEHGLVVGGRLDPAAPPPTHPREPLISVILQTTDGGRTWTDRVASLGLPGAEWAWKIFFLDRMRGFVSLEGFHSGAILKTTDGGQSWERLPINDPQGNKNLEGIGFLDEQTGWVGGWGDVDFAGGYTSQTGDGGHTWADANEVGKFINRFRFFDGRDDVGYACGQTVYKMSRDTREVFAVEAVGAAPEVQLLETNEPSVHGGEVSIGYIVPEGTEEVWLHMWDRFGYLTRTVTHERRPGAGQRRDVWDARDDDGREVPDGIYIYRLTADDAAESGVVSIRRGG